MIKKSILLIVILTCASFVFALEQQDSWGTWSYTGECRAVTKDIESDVVFNGCVLRQSSHQRWKCLDENTLQCSSVCPSKLCGVKGFSRSRLTGFFVPKYDYSYTYSGGCREGAPKCKMSDGNGWICASKTILQCTGTTCPAKACGSLKSRSYLTGLQVKPTMLTGKAVCVGTQIGTYSPGRCQTDRTKITFIVDKGDRYETCQFSATEDECKNQWLCASAGVLRCFGPACPDTACGVNRR